jgi:N-acetyl-gamma-glutamyl-phosphate reductase
MLTTIYATPSKKIEPQDIRDCIIDFYKDCPFIRLRPDENPPNTLHVRGTNYCDIGFKLDQRNNRLILMSVIDNLVKGAAGQAVQNMNIMAGIDETCGLTHVSYPI